MRRGEVWWASLPEPSGSGPGYRRPYLIVSVNSFNQSRINTVIAAVITSNLRLADAPGNVRLSVRGTGLTQPSVVNVSQVITIDKTFLTERVGRVPPALLASVDDGLRLKAEVEHDHIRQQACATPGNEEGDDACGREDGELDANGCDLTIAI